MWVGRLKILFLFLVSSLLFIYLFHLFLFPWRLITLQYYSGFCHTSTWISHRFTCVRHPDPPSHLPPHPIPSIFLKCSFQIFYRLNTISIKIPAYFFEDVNRMSLTFVWICKWLRIAKISLKKKNIVGELLLPLIKAYYKTRVIKMAWYWYKDRQIDQWNRIECRKQILLHKENWFLTNGQNIWTNTSEKSNISSH